MLSLFGSSKIQKGSSVLGRHLARFLSLPDCAEEVLRFRSLSLNDHPQEALRSVTVTIPRRYLDLLGNQTKTKGT